MISTALTVVNKKLLSIWRITRIITTLPAALLCFLIASIWHNRSFDPKKVINNKTPVLLIHGSDSNQQQWLLFRKFLAHDTIGHVFAVNLNKCPRKNDHNIKVIDYATVVHNKILSMKSLYAEAGYNMDHVILIGNSMGGLVAAAYCICDIEDKISVRTLVSISSPWKGSFWADYFCSEDVYPEKYFRRHSPDREDLIAKLSVQMNNGLPVYTYGSKYDILVTPESSKCLEAPCIIDDRNDHWTTMVDRKLAVLIRENWVQPHTKELNRLVTDNLISIR